MRSEERTTDAPAATDMEPAEKKKDDINNCREPLAGDYTPAVEWQLTGHVHVGHDGLLHLLQHGVRLLGAAG